MKAEIQAAIAAVLFVIFLTLGFGIYHYHEAWVEVKEDMSKLQTQYTQLDATAKACSVATEELANKTATKDADIRKAQGQAAVLAKANESLAQAILATKPSDPDSCKAAVKLYQDYKNKVIK